MFGSARQELAVIYNRREQSLPIFLVWAGHVSGQVLSATLFGEMHMNVGRQGWDGLSRLEVRRIHVGIEGGELALYPPYIIRVISFSVTPERTQLTERCISAGCRARRN